MKWLLALLPGGLVALVAWEIYRRRRDRRDTEVSAAWLKERGQQGSRVDFVSVGWAWPVDKLALDGAPLSEFEAAQLRRTA